MSEDAPSIPSSATWNALAQSLLDDDESPPPGDGTAFGDYQLEEEIARGGMGIVYRAWQVSLARPVAVKVMREGTFADGREIQRFRQEAEAAATLRHPGIVPVYESGTQDGRLFYAMEWVAGPNLAEVTRTRPATAKQAARWIREVAEAIAHAHAKGMIHRDLKPANVLLDPEGHTRVTDFGMAQRADTAGVLTLSRQMLGTPGYMAPEMAAGSARTAGAAADIYGLGATLFHLLTGRAPFIGESHASVLRQVMDAEPVSPRLLNGSVPRDLETICVKALQREPSGRFVNAQCLADDLARFLKDEPIHARPVSAFERAWRWCRRKPALAAAMAGVVLLGAGIIVTTLWSKRRIETLRREAVERLYASDMRLALQNIGEGKYGAAAALVDRHLPEPCGEDLRGFEWRLAREFCRSGERAALESMEGAVRTITVSPDGRWLAAGANNLRLWEVRDGLPVLRATRPDKIRAIAFAPDSRRLAVSFQGGGVCVLTVDDTSTAQRPAAFKEDVAALAWRTDGGTVEMIAGARQWRWSPGAGNPELAAELPGAARQPSFSSDGRRSAFMHEPAGGEAYRFTVWDAAAGRSLQTLSLTQDRILRSFNFSTDGRQLVTGDYGGRVALMDEPFAAETWTITPHRGMVDESAFSRDGTFAITSSGQSLYTGSFLNNYGLLQKNGTGTAELTSNTTHYGGGTNLNIEVNGGALVTTSNVYFQNGSNIRVANGAEVHFNYRNWHDGGTLNFTGSGKYYLNAGAFLSTTTPEVPRTFNSAPGVFDCHGGSLQGPFTNAGEITVSAPSRFDRSFIGDNPITNSGTIRCLAASAGSESYSYSIAMAALVRLPCTATSVLAFDISGRPADYANWARLGQGGQTSINYAGKLRINFGNFAPVDGDRWLVIDNFSGAPNTGDFAGVEFTNVPSGFTPTFEKLDTGIRVGLNAAPAPVNYNGWKDAQNFPSTTAAAFNADPDGDGWTNGMECALGTNPQSRGSQPDMGTLRKNSGGDIFFAAEFKRPAAALRPTDLQYVAERTDSLGNWTPNGLVVDVSPPDAQGRETLTVRPSEPMDFKTRTFVRLRVQQNP